MWEYVGIAGGDDDPDDNVEMLVVVCRYLSANALITVSASAGFGFEGVPLAS